MENNMRKLERNDDLIATFIEEAYSQRVKAGDYLFDVWKERFNKGNYDLYMTRAEKKIFAFILSNLFEAVQDHKTKDIYFIRIKNPQKRLFELWADIRIKRMKQEERMMNQIERKSKTETSNRDKDEPLYEGGAANALKYGDRRNPAMVAWKLGKEDDE